MSKIKVNHYGEQIKLKFNKDSNMAELTTMFRSIAYWMGYQPETIDEYIVDPNGLGFIMDGGTSDIDG